MKKKYSFKELSVKECVFIGCEKKLKKRLVDQKKENNITRCYKHHRQWKAVEAIRKATIKRNKKRS